jgi:murein DD-endopeptidase MepM/ murein hydrolase activator NlpD
VPEYLRIIKRVLISAYIVALHLIAAYLLLEKFGFIVPLDNSDSTAVSGSSQRATSPGTATPLQTGKVAIPTQMPSDTAIAPSNSLSLLIPVAGVRADELTDTFTQARSGGRVHDAIDIPAPAGAAVIAAADGTIVKFHDSVLGGTTIYQLSEDKNFVLYYAHLQRRVETLHEGDRVRRGETIGFVGDTGNAGAGNFHLHFAIWRITDPKRFWGGEDINPYPLLRSGAGLPSG